MKTTNKKPHVLILILAGLALFGACSPATQEQVTLRIAVLPILDTLPMHVAQQQGYFEKHGVAVEFINVASAPERDQIISAGKADGMLNEIVSTMLYNQDDIRVQIVRTARAATDKAPLFRILTAPGSGINSPEDLKGVEIGVSEGTVIEYITDRLLQKAGFSEMEIATIAVPKISDRLALLESGELQAAVLPDPLSSLAVQNGAGVALDDTSFPEVGLSVISFRVEVIHDHPEAVRAFLMAIEDAVEDINADPDRWSDVLIEKQLVPPPVLGDYQVNPFPEASIPTRDQWEDALAWMNEKGLIDGSLEYSESVTDEFLP